MSKRVFVTVGTTYFDELIQSIDNIEVIKSLSSQGYTELIMQIGKGNYIPIHGTELNITNVFEKIIIIHRMF